MSAGERPAILVDPYPRTLDQIFRPETRARLEALAEVTWHDGPPADDALVDAVLPRALAVVGQTALPRERLDRAPHLRAVVNVEGNFLPNVDYEACFERGVHVLVTAPVFADPVAELALGTALAAARGIVRGDAEIRAGTEELYDGDAAGAFLLTGATVGIVGFGSIGRRLRELLAPFRCRVLVHDPWLPAAEVEAAGAEPARLEELFAACRVVFLLSVVTTENAGAIGATLLGRMAPGGVVVLASRAAVVDFDALLEAAASGRVTAAIDVFPEEPIPAGDTVRDAPGTILSAHRAGNVPEVWSRMGEMVADDLELVLRGLPPRRCQRAERETVARLRSRPIG